MRSFNFDTVVDIHDFNRPSSSFQRNEKQETCANCLFSNWGRFAVKKNLELKPLSSKSFRIFPANISLDYSYQLTKFHELLSSKHISKNVHAPSYHDLTDLEVNFMVRNIETLIF